MPDTVRQRGIDTSGRPILASDRLWSVWLDVVAVLKFAPVITQGSWMSLVPGGGAEGSAGFHDKGGPFDLRTWNLTGSQVDRTVRVLREHGCAAWRRDMDHGGFKDPHIHFVLGADHDLSDGAARQWTAYLNGRDGLASDGRDYEYRPDPIVTEPPEGDDMPFTEEQLRAIIADELDKAEDRIKYEAPSGDLVAKRKWFAAFRKATS